MPKTKIPIFFVIIVFTFCWDGRSLAQETVELQPISVTATKFPQPSAESQRQLDVFEAAQIQALPVNNIPDALKLFPADIQSRGPGSTQSDISIRGSTFEQVLVLVDGLRVSDPQTGHFDLDIPVPLSQVERIEVLRGPASALYGADAFGGVINIITKKTDKTGAFVKGIYGQENTFSGEGRLSYLFKNFAVSSSVLKEKSNGQRYDTDYDSLSFFSKAEVDLPSAALEAVFGYQDKEFGAFDFYSPGRNFPSREWTNTKIVQLKGRTKNDIVNFEPKLFFRRHDDKFMLDQNNPAANVNYSTTYIYGGEFDSTIRLSGNNILLSGAEYSIEEIDSTSLGKHDFTKAAIFMQDNFDTGKFSLMPAVRVDYHSKYKFFISPSVSSSWMVSELLKLRGVIGRCFRAPSFTELYYNDPANKGDPDLSPEKAIAYEVGADIYPKDGLQAGGTLFLRDEKDGIDWVKRSQSDAQWQVANIGKMKTCGVETYLKKGLWKNAQVSLFYTYMGRIMDKSPGYISKYKLRAPKHQLNCSFTQRLPYEVGATLSATYKKRPGERSYTIFDAKISKQIRNFEIFFEVTNLGNSKYYEVLGIPASRRWFKIGCSARF